MNISKTSIFKLSKAALGVHLAALLIWSLFSAASSDAKLHGRDATAASTQSSRAAQEAQAANICRSRAELSALRAEMNSGKSCGKSHVVKVQKVGTIATLPPLDTYQVILQDECESQVRYELELRNDGRTCVVLNINEL